MIKQNAPLFIYDHDGTIADYVVRVWALRKKEDKNWNITLNEFKAQHDGETTLLVPGMADLVRFTANIGNNVLLSGGTPAETGCAELKSLLPLFQNWEHNGIPVALGHEPPFQTKDHPEVAQSLLKAFKPSMVVVIGDSDSERRLAQNIKATALFLRFSPQASLDGLEDIPNKHIIHTGHDIIPLLKGILGKRRIRRYTLHTLRNRVRQRD